MRILLPTVATALIIVVALWPQLSDQQRRYSITPAKVDAKATETVTMVNGVYTGDDEKQRPFTLTADSVQLASAGWTKVDMVSPKADILMLDGSWIAVTAKAGKYNRDEKILKLDGAVNLFHDSGYEFRTDAATIDMNAGDARGSKPVEGQGPFGNLKAEGFVIHNRGERIEFTGRSTIVLHPGQTPGG
jgi:lipopolysaccharide export system protein LptC